MTGADVKSGTVYCADCDNLIYNKYMEDLYHSVIIGLEEKETKFQGFVMYLLALQLLTFCSYKEGEGAI